MKTIDEELEKALRDRLIEIYEIDEAELASYERILSARIELQAARNQSNNSINEQAKAWKEITKKLDEVAPGWLDFTKTGIECALVAIDKLANQSNNVPVAIEALKERDRLGHTVVQVIGTLDEIIEQVEEITLHDVNYFAVPAELWHELQDALEEMPKRADSYTSPQQSNALEMAALTEALKWALSCIDVSDWEDDIHMSAACGKYAWAHHVLRKAQSAQPESDGK